MNLETVTSAGQLPAPCFRGEATTWRLMDAVGGAGGKVLEVELHREPCNEIGTTMLGELEQLAQFLREGAEGARALLFYSSVKKGFCAGADLIELHEGLKEKRATAAPSAASPYIKQAIRTAEKLRDRLPPRLKDRVDPTWMVIDAMSRFPVTSEARILRELRSFIDRIHDTFNAIDEANLFTVGAVHGFVFGGGFELALTCDALIAEKSTRFCFPELRLGLVPGFGGIPRLHRDVGNAVVRDLLLTGRSIRATRAHEIGLVSQVVNNGQALEVARMAAAQACRFDTDTTKRGKAFAKAVPYAELEREKRTFLKMVTSDTVQNALRKFAESTDLRPYLP